MKKRLTMMLACLFLSIGMALAQTTVKGFVVSSEDGEPVIGATVKVKGDKTDKGAVTNLDGEFKIDVKPGTQLVITYIGMQTATMPAKDGMKVTLYTDSEALGEVVVMGYGSARKLGTIAGSVSTVNSEKLSNRPVANVADALQGQVAGLQVMTSSGDPSATASMRIRGITSINAATEPLYILDGSMVSQNTYLSLNPNDIENVTVLKDASSTAVYGSLAANGVIVITTKKGKYGQAPEVSVSASYSMSQLAGDKTEVMDANQWLDFQQVVNPNLATNAGYLAKKNFYKKTGVSTNWRDYFFGSSAPTVNINASVRGGTSNANYLISYGHYKADGIMDDSSLRRETVRANVEIKVNDWLKLGSNTNLAYTKNTTTAFGSQATSLYNKIFAARMYLPTQSPYEMLDVDMEKGTFSGFGKKLHKYEDMTNIYSPEWLSELQPSHNDRIRINENVFVNLSPIKGLNIRSSLGLDCNDYRTFYKQLTTQGEDNNIFPTGQVSKSMSRFYRWTVTNTAEYKFNVARVHDFTVLLGQESMNDKTTAFSAGMAGLTDNRLLLMSRGVQAYAKIPGDSESKEARNSWFAMANYAYGNRYFLDLSGRRDGSSLFAEGNQWATFGAAALMWNVTGEKFMQSSKKWLDELHVKASYGVTGNANISSNLALALAGVSGNYNGVAGLGVVNPRNSELSWEKVKTLNIALSGRMFKRFTYNFEFFDKKTVDMILAVPVSYTTGFGSRYANVGSLFNRGFEATVGCDIFSTKDLYWNVSANVSYTKNEITKLFNGQDEYAMSDVTKLKVGHPYGEFYMVRWSHVDPADGQNVWLDKYGNETKVYDENNRVFTGKNSAAPWQFGLNSTTSWKGLTLELQFAGVFGRSMINQERYFIENPSFATQWNQSTKMLDMWQKPGDVTTIAAANAQRQHDTHLLENANFLRLKFLQLSYKLPQQWMNATHILKGVTVYFASRNLFTITNYSGYDPEVDGFYSVGNYPNTRQFSFGAQLTF